MVRRFHRGRLHRAVVMYRRRRELTPLSGLDVFRCGAASPAEPPLLMDLDRFHLQTTGTAGEVYRRASHSRASSPPPVHDVIASYRPPRWSRRVAGRLGAVTSSPCERFESPAASAREELLPPTAIRPPTPCLIHLPSSEQEASSEPPPPRPSAAGGSWFTRATLRAGR